ncbi:MAG: di-heme enzyme [Vicinamibacterales bacterium]
MRTQTDHTVRPSEISAQCRATLRFRVSAGLLLALLGWAIADAAQPPARPPLAYEWNLPRGFPTPKVPADNPMSVVKVELGRYLFYDTRMSVTGTFSCATCHQQERAFADDKRRGVGATGAVHPRGAMSLTNVAYNPVLGWANPTVTRLEDQALAPMFGTNPIELGLSGQGTALIEGLSAEPRYRTMFPEAFPDDPQPLTFGNITKAIAAFERTLISGRSPYDRYRTTFDMNAISPAAHRGEDLFFSDRVGCFHCHAGINFTQAVDFERRVPTPIEFHNTGLYNIDGKGGYPAPNTGVHAVTGKASDMGRFRPPTLRNIALTAPYMHDGSIATLDEVLSVYAAGGRRIADGSLKGDGTTSPLKSPLVKGFTLSDDDRADLLAFLQSLTDESFTTDPRFANPWTTSGTPRR